VLLDAAAWLPSRALNSRPVEIDTSHPIVDAVLERHADALGGDMSAYRNHVYRGINYHQLLLGAAMPDVAALAWATHDLGIWTAGTFDYLAPSAGLAAQHADEFGITEIDRPQRLITEHHRLRPSDDRMAETFRIADRIDVSRGLLRDGIGRSDVRVIVTRLPYDGFHAFLAKGLTRYAARHPLRPLPMLRW
jgi:hypothetical protein